LSKSIFEAENQTGPKKKTVDTENLDIGGDTPVERMDMVMPASEGLHLKNPDLHQGVAMDFEDGVNLV
jgi:hypothetical protein